MGIYNLNDQVYESLARVLNYLETMSTTEAHVRF
jgi:tetratricopeptide (TPR) repeat protein